MSSAPAALMGGQCPLRVFGPSGRPCIFTVDYVDASEDGLLPLAGLAALLTSCCIPWRIGASSVSHNPTLVSKDKEIVFYFWTEDGEDIVFCSPLTLSLPTWLITCELKGNTDSVGTS